MRSLRLLTVLLLFTAVAAACSPKKEAPAEPQAALPVVPETVEPVEVIREIHNVAYTGQVHPAGISIYMEGTHRLSMADGKFILLESDQVDLNGYVGERAEVIGSLRPTVESDTMIMRVEKIKYLNPERETGNGKRDAATPNETVESTESKESDPPNEESSEPQEAVSLAEPNEPKTPNPPPPEPDPPPPLSPSLQAATAVMAKHRFSSDQWTQSYCSSHIGFCVPVHRNWWYKSFGASGDSFWHVEMNGAPLENLGEGPITVDFLLGTLNSIGKTDGEIVAVGDFVIAYRSWSQGNRRFEVKAPRELKAAVKYIADQLAPTSE